MNYAPFFFKLDALPCLIVGGGSVALAKAGTLLGCGARLHVAAETILPELQAMLERNGGSFALGGYDSAMLDGVRIVVAATDDRALNSRIRDDARLRNIPVNVVDDPELCDFIFPAIVQRGDIQIAISTAGVSPTLARYLKRRIEQVLPWNLDQLSDWLKVKRREISKRLGHLQTRRLFWDEVIEGPIAQEVLEGNNAKADALLAQALADHDPMPRAALYLIGAGPGHPDLITVRGAQLLAQADIVLYDRLIPPDVLTRYARRDALKISVGKSANRYGMTQPQIDALIAEHLAANRIVVRLKGGDPGIYAHAVEELEIARRLDVPWQIVPGITAAAGCAAAAGIPLTERSGANGVRFLTLYDEKLHDQAFWQSLALNTKDTLVFYMTTRQRALLCRKLLEAGFNSATPLLIVEQGTTPGHAEYEATIESFAARYGDHAFMTPALIIVGDVVRWRARYGWKEPPQQRRVWFGEMKEDRELIQD